ncbi:MAG: hypothetical protein FD180_4003 [Planctomycetota bacterium]|nr:MAG: hypothetical protein FD180_4003 [Planctomycetota bacterium]
MFADDARMRAYEEALRRVVTPRSTVLDIGAGTGMFSFIACRLGAARVWGIEPSEAIQVARDIAAANGFGDRIRFFHGESARVELPGRADVIVSDLRGALPLLPYNIPSIIDARRRFLTPGGVLIGKRDTLWAAPVEAPGHHARFIGPWESRPFGLDLGAGLKMVTNSGHPGTSAAGPIRPLADSQCWGTIDYPAVETPDMKGEFEVAARVRGTAHGILLWFDAELADGITLSNAPGKPELVWGRNLLPLSSPVEVEAGDVFCVTLEARLVGGEYVFGWNTRVTSPDGSPKASFRQSTFHGKAITLETLRRAAEK